jgi:cytochrome c-type biogenesis protein CcmH/NrfG
MAEKTSNRASAGSSTQAYLLAAFCLVLGVALGYLFRGSASPGVQAAQASSSTTSSAAAQSQQPQLTPEQQKATVDQAVAPLLATLKNNPDDFNSLIQVANIYFDGRQYPEAITYYRRAAKGQPTNSDVLTDLGTAIWYTGDADGAITEFQTALKYRPDHPGTLFNLGIVRWQGKLDPKGAVEAWEQLLKLNPNYPEKQQVQEYIDRAKQHSKG